MEESLSIHNDTVQKIEHDHKSGSVVVKDNLSKLMYNNTVVWPNSYRNRYITITALDDYSKKNPCVIWDMETYGTDPKVEYSYDTVNWSELPVGMIVEYDKYLPLYLRGKGIKRIHLGVDAITGSSRVKISGSIYALWNYALPDEDDAIQAKNRGCYCKEMFAKCHYLVDMSDFEMPNEVWEQNQYESTFEDCVRMERLPRISIPNTKRSCCTNMFKGCAALQEAPALPSTTLTDYCYMGMFQGCSNLLTPPELPATTLTFACYKDMFKGSGITTTAIWKATLLEEQCCANMYAACDNLSTVNLAFPKSTKLPKLCYASMFAECHNLESVKTVYVYVNREADCMVHMFANCSKLSFIACNLISPSAYSTEWVMGVATNGTYDKLGSTGTITYGDNAVPVGWTVIN